MVSIISHRGTIHRPGSQRQQSLRDRRNWYVGWFELIVVERRRIYSHSSHSWRRETWPSRALQLQHNTLDITLVGGGPDPELSVSTPGAPRSKGHAKLQLLLWEGKEEL